MRLLLGLSGILVASATIAQELEWYTQGDFEPTGRVAMTVITPREVDRPDSTVVVRFADFPQQDIAEMLITVVDPALPPAPAPTCTQKARDNSYRTVSTWITGMATLCPTI